MRSPIQPWSYSHSPELCTHPRWTASSRACSCPWTDNRRPAPIEKSDRWWRCPSGRRGWRFAEYSWHLWRRKGRNLARRRVASFRYPQYPRPNNRGLCSAFRAACAVSCHYRRTLAAGCSCRPAASRSLETPEGFDKTIGRNFREFPVKIGRIFELQRLKFKASKFEYSKSHLCWFERSSPASQAVARLRRLLWRFSRNCLASGRPERETEDWTWRTDRLLRLDERSGSFGRTGPKRTRGQMRHAFVHLSCPADLRVGRRKPERRQTASCTRAKTKRKAPKCSKAPPHWSSNSARTSRQWNGPPSHWRRTIAIVLVNNCSSNWIWISFDKRIHWDNAHSSEKIGFEWSTRPSRI